MRWLDATWSRLPQPRWSRPRAVLFALPVIPSRKAPDWKSAALHLVDAVAGRPEPPRVAKRPSGQPYLPNVPLHISISHSGCWLVIALANSAVGVDVEGPRPGMRWQNVYNWISAPEERVESPSIRTFLAAWTAKEAALKAMGKGLDSGLHTVALPRCLAQPGSGQVARAPMVGAPLWLAQLPCLQEYAVSLASRTRVRIDAYRLTDNGAARPASLRAAAMRRRVDVRLHEAALTAQSVPV